MAQLPDDIANEIMRSLDEVGLRKAVGYLPILTLNNVLGLKIDQVTKRYQAKGLKVKLFGAEDTCIKSGALFVYDHRMFACIARNFRAELASKGWLTDTEFILDKIAGQWFERDNSIMPLIAALYGEDL